MPCTVVFSEHFTGLYDGLSDEEKRLIKEFVFYAQATGLQILPHTFPGKIASTANVPPGAYDRAAKIAYAKHHNLWHAHIGYRQWNHSRNPTVTYMTSKYVVHFQLLDDSSIAMVGYGDHSPMTQPLPHHLFTP